LTREELEAIKRKPHGPDVKLLIEEIESLWEQYEPFKDTELNNE